MADRGKHREYLVSGKPLSSLRVVDLKAELDKRSLPKSGSKKDLVERLRLHLELEESREAAQKDQEAEEHVPNLSLANEAIAENDFIREYLAAQQACYQSQREAKKQYEEQQRESEASAEETTQDEDESACETSRGSPSKSIGSAKKSGKSREKRSLMSPEQTFASTSLLSSISKYDSPMQTSTATEFASPVSGSTTTMFQSPETHPYSTPPPEHALPVTRQRDAPPPPVIQSDRSPLSKPVTEETEDDQPVNLTARAMDSSPNAGQDSTLVVDKPPTQVSCAAPQDLTISGPSTSTPILHSKKRKFLQYAEKAEAEDEEASAAKVLAEMASGKIAQTSPVKPLVVEETKDIDKQPEEDIQLKELEEQPEEVQEQPKEEDVESKEVQEQPKEEDAELKEVQEQPKEEPETPKEVEQSPQQVQEEVKEAEESKQEHKIVNEETEQVQDEPREVKNEVKVEEPQELSQENKKTLDATQDKPDHIQEESKELANRAKTEKELQEEDKVESSPAASILPTPEPEPNTFKGPPLQLEDAEPMDIDTTLTTEDSGVVLPVSVPSKESIAVVEKPVEDELSSNKSVRGSPVPPVEEIKAEEGAAKSPTPQSDASEAKDLAEPEPSSLEPASRETEQGMGGRNGSARSSPSKAVADEEKKPIQNKEDLPVKKEEDASTSEDDKGDSKEVEKPVEKGTQKEQEEEKVIESVPKTDHSTPTVEKVASATVDKESKADEEEDELQIEKDESEDEESIQKRSDQQMSDSESGSDDDTQRYRRSSRPRKSRSPEPPHPQPVLPPVQERPEVTAPTQAKRLKRDNLTTELKTEAPEVQPLEPVVPLRKLKLRTSKSVEGNAVNGNEGSQVQKRRWTSSVTQQPSEPSLIISTESLKDIVPDAKLLAPEEVRLTSPEPERPERVKRPRLDHPVAEPVVAAPVKKERTISVQNIEPEPLAPANNPTSNVIIVTNLVRPFTINQLRELLCRTGNLVPNAFWIDRVKSTCLAQYESVDEAVATRSALHGVHWPVSNPKTLVVDFATEQELQDCQEGKKESLGAPATANTNATAQPVMSDKPPTEEQNTSDSINRRAKEEKEERGWEVKGPVREWDRAKIGEVVPGEREFKREQEKREREREDRAVRPREEKPAASGAAKDEAPAKLLDDLFRKTKTTPCIYWLPLTAEQIAEKEEMRRQRIAEREKRLAESQRAREESARARSERDLRDRDRDRKPRRDSSPRRR